MADVVKGGAFAILAVDNSTATDIPDGAWVPPKGSEFVGGNQQAQWVAEYGGGQSNQTVLVVATKTVLLREKTLILLFFLSLDVDDK